jgi:hypothetical protein
MYVRKRCTKYMWKGKRRIFITYNCVLVAEFSHTAAGSSVDTGRSARKAQSDSRLLSSYSEILQGSTHNKWSHFVHRGAPNPRGPLNPGSAGVVCTSVAADNIPILRSKQPVWALYYLLIRKLIWSYRENRGVCSCEQNARQNHAQKRVMNLLKCGKVKIFGKPSNKSKLNAPKRIKEKVKGKVIPVFN